MSRREPRVDRPVFLFAGDRGIAVDILTYLVGRGDLPAALCVSAGQGASHAEELVRLYREEADGPVLRGDEFRRPEHRHSLGSLDLDLALSVHFPYIVPPDILRVPGRGWINLHPAYLPHNRGWHTPSWAILDKTPAGATLHRMVEEVDAGPIIARRRVPVLAHDTADTLYGRILRAERSLFEDVWPRVRTGDYATIPNRVDEGSFHAKGDLAERGVRFLDLDETTTGADLIDRLRALTTSDPSEACYFQRDGQTVRVSVELHPEPQCDA